MKIGNTTILVDDTYMPKSEEERQERYELFNQIGCEIINNSSNQSYKKGQTYEKIKFNNISNNINFCKRNS